MVLVFLWLTLNRQIPSGKVFSNLKCSLTQLPQQMFFKFFRASKYPIWRTGVHLVLWKQNTKSTTFHLCLICSISYHISVRNGCYLRNIGIKIASTTVKLMLALRNYIPHHSWKILQTFDLKLPTFSTDAFTKLFW